MCRSEGRESEPADCDEVPEGYWERLTELLKRMPVVPEDDFEGPDPIL